jgi:hypothetical protein
MAHNPLVMVGPKENGMLGIYTADEIKDWIIGKLDLSETDKKSRGGPISSVVSDFMSGKGKATSGPNKHVPHKGFMAPNLPHTSLYRGNPIYHASAGSAGKGNGITIFYVNAQGNDGKIIGIGSHVNSTNYEIEWHVPDWHVGRTVQLA